MGVQHSSQELKSLNLELLSVPIAINVVVQLHQEGFDSECPQRFRGSSPEGHEGIGLDRLFHSRANKYPVKYVLHHIG